LDDTKKPIADSHNQKQQSFFSDQTGRFLARGVAYMKLRQIGTVFMITLAALEAGLNSEPQNIE